MSETSYQAYFLKAAQHAYRTALVTGSGFPDVIVLHGEDRYSLVELKLLSIGPSGNRKLKSLFKKSQPPWYAEYLARGADRLFVVFRLKDVHGLLHVDMDFVRNIENIRYGDLPRYRYREYPTVSELLEALDESKGD